MTRFVIPTRYLCFLNNTINQIDLIYYFYPCNYKTKTGMLCLK